MVDKYAQILEQYELEITAVRRGRGAWICETDKGLKLLKEYQGTEKRVQFEQEILEQLLNQKEFELKADSYIKNKEDLLISTADDGTKYVMKEWFDERECNIKDSGEVMKAVTRIAALHKAFRNVICTQAYGLGSAIAQPLEDEMERHNKELRRARSYIRNKRRKSEFELCVINNFDRFYSQAEEAKKGIENIMKTCSENKLYLCHGDLDHHHILMGKSYIIIEYNRMRLGNQISDLYRFTRKVLEKQDWDLELGLSMLETYEKIMPMTEVDKKCLYYMFRYPEKYWKQINFYYNANKAWIPERNIEKLKNQDAQLEKRERFLSEIM